MVVSAQNTYQYYIRAAKNGDADAQCRIGSCYSKGTYVEKDDKKAVDWWKKAAKQGHALSQGFLGQAYFTGKGVTMNPSQAVYWYQKSAEQGNTTSQCSLALCYMSGKGVQKDNTQAFYWWSKAAEQGFSMAQYWMGVYYSNGWEVAKNMGHAFNWYRKAAEQGHAGAQLCVGYCYYEGEGVSRDYSQAVYWIQKSLDNGETKAKDYLDIAIKKLQEQEAEKKRRQDSIAFAKKQQQQEDSLALVRMKEKYMHKTWYYRKRDWQYPRFEPTEVVDIQIHRDSTGYVSFPMTLKYKYTDKLDSHNAVIFSDGTCTFDLGFHNLPPEKEYPTVRHWKAVKAYKVVLGMNHLEVELAWGIPDDINTTKGSWGVHEQWVYTSLFGGHNRYVYFKNGRVYAIQE